MTMTEVICNCYHEATPKRVHENSDKAGIEVAHHKAKAKKAAKE